MIFSKPTKVFYSNIRTGLKMMMGKQPYNIQYRGKDTCAHLDSMNYMNKRVSKNRHIGVVSIVLLTVPVSCFVLAFWQVKRKIWKEELIKVLKLKTAIPTIDLPMDLSDRQQLEYRRVRVRGTFDHDNEMYLGPSRIIDPVEGENKGTFLFSSPNVADKYGYLVITPFQLADRDMRILVNRGWVSNDQRLPKTRREGQIEGEVELEGIVRLRDEKPMGSSQMDYRKKIFNYRDLVNMAEMADTSYLYIDAVAESTVPGGPIGGQTQVVVRNQHLSYIIFWTTIGIVFSRMWYRRYILKL